MRHPLACLLAAASLHGPALAQDTPRPDRSSHLGVIATFSPTSAFSDRFDVLFDVDRVDVRSHDLEVGLIVRGRHVGGDWGVSYVRKTYREGSTLDGRSSSCIGTQCYEFGPYYTFGDVTLSGVSLHKFAPFVTLKRRVQIGMTFGGGVGQVKGRVERRQTSICCGQTQPTVDVTEEDASDLFFGGSEWIPIWKAELTGAVLLAPGLKARAGVGIRFTNYPAASVSLSYLIGAK